jgi:DNA-binding GntR family transcriptional regulator
MSALRARIIERLREAILAQDLRPGSLLLEKEVAERFGVSKTPAREALSLLCEEGLVQLLPRRGYVVQKLSIDEIRDTFDLRLILEGSAAQRAAIHMSDSLLRALDTLAAHDCCTSVQPSRDPASNVTQHSLDFHLLIAQGSGNLLLAAAIEKLLRSSRRITLMGFTYGEHQGIVEALKARDPDRARRVMEDHVRSAMDAAIQSIAEPRSQLAHDDEATHTVRSDR